MATCCYAPQRESAGSVYCYETEARQGEVAKLGAHPAHRPAVLKSPQWCHAEGRWWRFQKQRPQRQGLANKPRTTCVGQQMVAQVSNFRGIGSYIVNLCNCWGVSESEQTAWARTHRRRMLTEHGYKHFKYLPTFGFCLKTNKNPHTLQ